MSHCVGIEECANELWDCVSNCVVVSRELCGCVWLLVPIPIFHTFSHISTDLQDFCEAHSTLDSRMGYHSEIAAESVLFEKEVQKSPDYILYKRIRVFLFFFCDFFLTLVLGLALGLGLKKDFGSRRIHT